MKGGKTKRVTDSFGSIELLKIMTDCGRIDMAKVREILAYRGADTFVVSHLDLSP